MRVLMVTPYPPIRDGIAAYAVQEVKRLRAEGHHVEVLSPGPSAAHHHVNLSSARGPLALAKRVRRYDRVIVQYHPEVFYRPSAGAQDRVRIGLGLTVAFALARHLELRVHEIDYSPPPGNTPAGLVARLVLLAADRITVHTEAERDALQRAYGLQQGHVSLVEHGSHFLRRTALDREAARERLGLPAEAFTFLSIGFVQPHKGFDRAVRAFGAANLAEVGCRLDVVGSVRLEEPGYVEYVRELRALVRATPGAELHERFVSDEEFDVWLVASDALVLPYRHIWSSSVAARGTLYGRPVIATRVGGLEHQAAEATVLVDDDPALAAAMRQMAAERLGSLPDTEALEWGRAETGGREGVQDAIRALARRDRGGRGPRRRTGAPGRRRTRAGGVRR